MISIGSFSADDSVFEGGAGRVEGREGGKGVVRAPAGMAGCERSRVRELELYFVQDKVGSAPS